MMSKKLYTIRMGVMRVHDVVRTTNKGWYVTSKGTSDVYIAKNNLTVRSAAANGDLSYYEYNRVTTSRKIATEVVREQVQRYARHQRISMMQKLNRPIVDVIEITNVIDAAGGTSTNVYHNGGNGICVVSYDSEHNLRQGFEVTYTGDPVRFEDELSLQLTKLMEKL